MRRLVTYLAALSVMLVMAGQASATAAAVEPHCGSKTAKVELACATRALHRDLGTVRWVKNHPGRVLFAEMPHSPGFYRWRVKVDHGWIREAHHHLYASRFPPHHALWMCEHSHEAQDWHNENTGGNGHYGGMQMTLNWGWNQYAHYGLPGDPAKYSQLQQEWAAERGYRHSGFSQAWLLGQWAHYDCLRYA